MTRWLKQLTAATVVGGAIAGCSWVIYDIAARPVLEVNITGSFEHVSRQDLEKAIQGVMSPGFFAVDVSQIKGAVTALEWIRDARVRRVWPNSLEIEIQERTPVARWADEQLVEADGSLFLPPRSSDWEAEHRLPHLIGPKGSERRLLSAWGELDRALGVLPRGQVVSVELTRRGDWFVKLANGMEVVTDRVPGEGLLVRVAPSLGTIFGERLLDVARIDMRYGHGFAVRWREQTGQGKEAS